MRLGWGAAPKLKNTPKKVIWSSRIKSSYQKQKSKEMTKRVRDTRLTREQIEAGDYGEEDDNVDVDPASSRATLEQLAQRKIIKVKRHIQSTGEVKEETPKKPTSF